MQPLQQHLTDRPNFRQLARALTVVENDLPGADSLLASLNIDNNIPVTGITGPPGAGKSTLVNAVIEQLAADGKKVAVLAIDPTSPFNHGSLLGDRIRMSPHFNNPNVFIRSLATRGALGGLSAHTIEMTDVLRAAGFDHIIIETVGVGQSEVEIAALADLTLLVLVPESGDEIQNIKSGVMEIADAFIINKADRDGADTYYNTLKKLVHQGGKDIPIYKATASRGEGIDQITQLMVSPPLRNDAHRALLMAEKAWQIIRNRRMADVDKKKLRQDITEALKQEDFNLYRFLSPLHS